MNIQTQHLQPKERTVVLAALWQFRFSPPFPELFSELQPHHKSASGFGFFLVFCLIVFQSPCCFQIFSSTGKITGWVWGLVLSKPPSSPVEGPCGCELKICDRPKVSPRDRHPQVSLEPVAKVSMGCQGHLPAPTLAAVSRGDSPEPFLLFPLLMADRGRQGRRRRRQWGSASCLGRRHLSQPQILPWVYIPCFTSW